MDERTMKDWDEAGELLNSVAGLLGVRYFYPHDDWKVSMGIKLLKEFRELGRLEGELEERKRREKAADIKQ
jgi:hypothetical protein